MTLPNFLILGAAKCGTTSLYNYLLSHPDVLENRCEPRRTVIVLAPGAGLVAADNRFTIGNGVRDPLPRRGEVEIHALDPLP